MSTSLDDLDRATAALRSAWRGGRSIIPIVGAGLSADSGIPTITSVVRYFAKFQQFLNHRAFLPRLQGPGKLEAWVRELGDQPWKYVQGCGWPDRYDLNQDLLLRLEETSACGSSIDGAVNEALRDITRKV